MDHVVIEIGEEASPRIYPIELLRSALETLSTPLAVTTDWNEIAQRNGSVKYLAEFCHSISRSRGWWTHPHDGMSLLGRRNFGEMLALMHSEVSEAYLADARLCPKTGYPEIVVELADVLIREFDLIEAEGISFTGEFAVSRINRVAALRDEVTIEDYLMHAHADITEMLEGHRTHNNEAISLGAAKLIDHVFEGAAHFGFNLTSAFLAKCAYNLGRPDHSMEARRAAGGKAY